MARMLPPSRRAFRAARLFSLVGFSVLAAAATGCVSQEKYNAKDMQAASYAEQLAQAESRVNSETAQNKVYKEQMDRIRQSSEGQAALLVNQAQTIAELTRANEDLNTKLAGAMDNVARAGTVALPAPLTNELTSFAAQNPDFVDFDPGRGLVKFKSDFTFDKGSAELRPEARATIDRLAGILNGPNASQYELMVVGHTDDQPVSNPNTIRAGHRDNWYLSAHRAISVGQRLMQVGVNRQRIQVAGYADQRPMVPNSDESAKAKNRRVEVFILPTTARRAGESIADKLPPAGGNGARQAAGTGLNKDTPMLPGMNKDTAAPRTADIDARPPVNK